MVRTPSSTATRRARTTRPKLSTITRWSSVLAPTGHLLRQRRVGQADPAAPAGPALLLPDRHGALQLVDQLPAGGERLVPVRRGRGHDHARLGTGHRADAVGQVDGAEPVTGGG